jgi:hypothetical protein
MKGRARANTQTSMHIDAAGHSNNANARRAIKCAADIITHPRITPEIEPAIATMPNPTNV